MDHFHFQSDAGLELLICEPFAAAGLLHAFTSRVGGVSPLPDAALNLGNFSQDSRENILENRRRLRRSLGVEEWPLVTLRQVHSPDIYHFDNPATVQATADGENGPTADGVITNLAQVLVAVQTADCLPILLADLRTGAIAAVHAGWRGTLAGIVARTVDLMQQNFGSHPGDMLAAIGPAIGSCCFEVGPEVITRFTEKWDDADQLVSHRQPGGKAHLDLPLANRLQLRQAGMADSSIFDCQLCTICHNHRFFSYRFELGAERPVGRLMGVIGRRNVDVN
jgi:YfiH family protein